MSNGVTRRKLVCLGVHPDHWPREYELIDSCVHSTPCRRLAEKRALYNLDYPVVWSVCYVSNLYI